MDGRQAMRQIRKYEAQNNCRNLAKIIFISANIMESEIQDCLREENGI